MKVIKPLKRDYFREYPGQGSPQPVVVELDCEKQALSIRYDPAIGSGVPESVWNRRTYWFKTPMPESVESARHLLACVAPLAKRLLAGHSIAWDSQSHVGQMTEEASTAYDEIVQLCEEWQ